ncbi:recombination mediator RecR [Gayadomonas joobiniege]|uniref:recombination mediator RecR n=1 Tax=Gayadomonas joobiniege TaxID=1234606 RepID=UPI00037FCB6C|nr:recombination mediator RecR [Gayadomonas joobiniege]
MLPPILEELIQALRLLPGVGPKSAQRMAFLLLEDKAGATALASALQQAVSHIHRCQRCQNYSQTDICHICQQPERIKLEQICVVSSPLDVLSFEQASLYQGSYFVTHGLLSPIDGIGAEELKLDQLEQLSKQLSAHGELILALPASVEGEATSYFISQFAKQHACKVTRLAQGLSAGRELANADSRTLSHAFSGRTQI